MAINEQEAAKSELKIRKISNGWLLKGRDGWNAFTTMPALLAAIEAALRHVEDAVDVDAQPRFFTKDWPRQGK